MHELSIAESVVSSVLERTGDRDVRVVRVRTRNPATLGSAVEVVGGG